jgi:hypothetical protein
MIVLAIYRCAMKLYLTIYRRKWIGGKREARSVKREAGRVQLLFKPVATLPRSRSAYCTS